MKEMKRQIQVWAGVAAMVWAFSSTPAQATLLIFEKSGTDQFAHPDKFWGTPSSGNFPDYGDNVTNATMDVSGAHGESTIFHYNMKYGPTPDIVAIYTNDPSASPQPNAGMGAYSDSVFFAASSPVLFPFYTETNNRRMITLESGHATQLVSLYELSLGPSGAVDSLRVIRINDDLTETTVWSTNSFTMTGGIAGTTFNTTHWGGSIVGRRLAIDFDPVPNHNNFWFDNIGFAQEIPEPSAMAMLAVAGMVAWRRKSTRNG